MYDYPSIKDWVENEWHFNALVIGIDDSVFWHLTPKTIQTYFKAYNKKRKMQIQDIWLQGYYFKWAIVSSLQFSKQKPPDYPEMPYKDEEEKELAKDENWLKRQREIAFNHFSALLSRNKK